MVQVIDTDLVPRGKRAEYLLEAVEHSPLPRIDLSKSYFNDDGFRARFSGRMLGDAFLTKFDATAVRLTRADREIAAQSSRLILLAFLNRGSYDQHFDYRPSFPTTNAGDFLLLDLDAPQRVTFGASTLTNCAYIPRHYFEPFLTDSAFVRPALFRPDHELYGLLGATFRECLHLKAANLPTAAGALRTLTHVALVARGLSLGEDNALRLSIRQARLSKAQRFIEDHCDDPCLNARKIAAHFNISLRSLHLLFEGSGGSVTARITTARLRKAKNMLIRMPQRSALDIALACGFNNLSTFYKCFAETFGMPPGEFRRYYA